MYIDSLHVDPLSCALCSLVDVFPCVASFLASTIRDCFFLHFSNCPPLIAIRLSPHHPPPVGYWVVRHFSMSILYSLRPYLPSFETTQKHTDLFSPKAPPKKVLFLPFTSLPAPSPFTTLPSLPDSPQSRFYVTYICSFTGDILSHFCYTRMSFLVRLSFRTDDALCATLIQWITIMSPWEPKAV